MSFVVSIPKECSFLVNSSGEGPDAPRELSRGASSSPGPKKFRPFECCENWKIVGINMFFKKKCHCIKRCTKKQCCISFSECSLSSHCLFIGLHNLVNKLFPNNENQDYLIQISRLAWINTFREHNLFQNLFENTDSFTHILVEIPPRAWPHGAKEIERARHVYGKRKGSGSNNFMLAW